MNIRIETLLGGIKMTYKQIKSLIKGKTLKDHIVAHLIFSFSVPRNLI